MIKQFRLFDEITGEILVKSESKGSELGEDWFVMYPHSVENLLNNVPNFATLKVFLHLATMQKFEGEKIVIKRQALADKVGINRMTLYKALKWLVENEYIQEVHEGGYNGFLLNPNVTFKGKGRGEAMRSFDMHRDDVSKSSKGSSGRVIPLGKAIKLK